jgi:hypothetical protein
MPIPLADLLTTCRRSPADLKLGEVLDLVHGFGPLASWWLDRTILERAFGVYCRPSLPAVTGSCWVVFAQDSPPLYPCLAAAYLLPLEWRPDTSHSQRLPAKLIALASSVTQELGAEGWGLHPSAAAGLAEVSLQAADGHLEVKSGWAALAGGLVVALDRGKPDPRVWATGRWEGDPPGIRPVGHLDAKIALAAAYGRGHFFVPATQVAEAESIVARAGYEGVQIGSLEEGVSDARVALRAYRRRLRTAPGRSDPGPDRRDYYLGDLDPQEEKHYYRENLLPDILKSIREKWEVLGGGVPVTHLVTIASDNPALVVMAASAVRPTGKCLVLYTADKMRQWEDARNLLEREKDRFPCKVVPVSFESMEKLLEKMKERVQSLLQGASSAEVVLDLTPGSKEMSLVLALEAAQPGNRLYYLRHDRQGPKVVPFSERPLLWQVSGSGPMRSNS